MSGHLDQPGEPLYHGWLVKRSVGRSIGLLPSWRKRYIVLFSGEIRWYENVEIQVRKGPM